jgi:hypothetical protein
MIASFKQAAKEILAVCRSDCSLSPLRLSMTTSDIEIENAKMHELGAALGG